MPTEAEQRMFSAHKAETADLEKRLAEITSQRDDAVASLAKRSQELAACQAELKQFRGGACVCAVKTTSLVEVECDRLRGLLQKVVDWCSCCHGDLSMPCDSPGCEERRFALISKPAAALKPTTENLNANQKP